MYLDYFGFKQPPFSITPDPEFVFLSEKHQESLAHLIYGVTRGGGAGFVQLTGEVGTGKTTISRLFLQKLPENTQAALLLNPTVTPLELMENIFKELHISRRGVSGKLNRMVDRLNEHLLTWWSEGKNTVVIIDEAQNIPRDTLEHLRLLTNLETDQQKLLQIILIGQPELKTTMQRKDLRQLAQRITSRFHLQSLSKDETENYINHRVAISGNQDSIFDKSAINSIYKHTNGTPRLINVLCDRALLAAYADNAKKVLNRHIKIASNEVFDTAEKNKKNPYIWPITCILIALIVASSLYYFYPFDKENKGKEIALEKPTFENLNDITLMPAAKTWDEYFALWQVKTETTWNKSTCPDIALTGMSCLRKNSNLNKIIQQNSPVILQLHNDRLALLVAAETDHATVLTENGLSQILQQDLNKHWYGGYFVLWPIPADVVNEKNQDISMQWALKMAQTIENKQPVNLDNLPSWIQDFQKHNGLLADGIIGKETQMALALKAYQGPKLKP